MKMIISTPQNYFIDLHRVSGRGSREKSYVKTIWHTVEAEHKLFFTLLSLPLSSSFLPASFLSSSPTLGAAKCWPGCEQTHESWKLLSFYLTVAYCSLSPRQTAPEQRSAVCWFSLTAYSCFVQWMTLVASGAAVLGTSECWPTV